jgi:hypothetical protein
MSSQAERNVYISCRSLMKVVWFWCIRYDRKDYNLLARILVMIFHRADGTLIGI